MQSIHRRQIQKDNYTRKRFSYSLIITRIEFNLAGFGSSKTKRFKEYSLAKMWEVNILILIRGEKAIGHGLLKWWSVIWLCNLNLICLFIYFDPHLRIYFYSFRRERKGEREREETMIDCLVVFCVSPNRGTKVQPRYVP